MKVLISCSGERFDLVGYTERWMVVASVLWRDMVFVLAGDLVEESKVKMKASSWI